MYYNFTLSEATKMGFVMRKQQGIAQKQNGAQRKTTGNSAFSF